MEAVFNNKNPNNNPLSNLLNKTCQLSIGATAEILNNTHAQKIGVFKELKDTSFK